MTPVFAQASQGPEIWVLLMEKAWAKLHGSYCAIIAGNTEKVVRDLTGAPYETYKLSDNGLW
jgi:hypothetical protein